MSVLNQRQWYIHSKKSDALFIILTPLLSFFFICLVCEPRFRHGAFLHGEETPYWFAILATLLTHSHVLLVFLRSHLNLTVFKKFPYRFTIIPLVLLIGMWVSPLLLGTMGILAAYWDEWHSLMQTFGFGRIYDVKAGSPANIGRKLDMGMCFVLGLLPHLILFTYIPESVKHEGLVRYFELTDNAIAQFGHTVSYFRMPLYLFGIGYPIYYIYQYQKLIREGYVYSKAKLALFCVTGITTILTALFFTVADGVFFGNIYHAIQYYFIVLITERPNLSTLTGIPQSNKKGLNAVYFLVVLPFVFVMAGLRQTTSTVEYLAAFWILSSLLHFWFDGFIWSVRKQDI